MLVPLGCPDADKIPAESLQNLCPEPVPIAGNLRGPVVRAVAENTGKVHTKLIRIFYCNVNPEPGTSDILRNMVTVVLQQPRDGVTEQSGHIIRSFPTCTKRSTAIGSIGQECCKSGNSGGRPRLNSKIRSPEVGKHHTAFTGTGDQNIQPPLTAVLIERTKVSAQLVVFIKPVPDTDKHRVAFISLHGFQVLDKEVLAIFRTHQ